MKRKKCKPPRMTFNIQCIANKELICFIFGKNSSMSRNHTNILSSGDTVKNVATIVVFTGIIRKEKN